MAIFNSYVSLPEGNVHVANTLWISPAHMECYGCGSPILPDNGMENCQQAWRNTTTPLEKHSGWLLIEGSKCTAQFWGENPGKLVCSVRDVIRVFFPTLLSCFYIYHLHLLQTTTKDFQRSIGQWCVRFQTRVIQSGVMHLRKLKSKYVQVILSHTIEKS